MIFDAINKQHGLDLAHGRRLKYKGKPGKIVGVMGANLIALLDDAIRGSMGKKKAQPIDPADKDLVFADADGNFPPEKAA